MCITDFIILSPRRSRRRARSTSSSSTSSSSSTATAQLKPARPIPLTFERARTRSSTTFHRTPILVQIFPRFPDRHPSRCSSTSQRTGAENAQSSPHKTLISGRDRMRPDRESASPRNLTEDLSVTIEHKPRRRRRRRHSSQREYEPQDPPASSSPRTGNSPASTPTTIPGKSSNSAGKGNYRHRHQEPSRHWQSSTADRSSRPERSAPASGALFGILFALGKMALGVVVSGVLKGSESHSGKREKREGRGSEVYVERRRRRRRQRIR